MPLQFGDRTSGDGTIRCRRCGHGIILRGGDAVPRCYCGGEDFEDPKPTLRRVRMAAPARKLTSRHDPTRGEPSR
jgi:DNA-directed RNA polymerase subunit RPC12/RpoP